MVLATECVETSDNFPTPCHRFMLVPSLACQASCRYCFGPNKGATMSLSVLEAAIDFIRSLSERQNTVEITFHGGEPLLAGIEWYETALPLLRATFGERLRLSVQSNLWEMSDTLARLFRTHGVGIGTSLDGPEAINDAQRGAGYFARTMEGIRTARRHGMEVGVICTFTALSAPRYMEVCRFFAREGLAFSVHGAAGRLRDNSSPLALPPEAHEALFLKLFRHYMQNTSRMEIPTFDLMARGLAEGEGRLCTFSRCLGEYFAVSPDGGVYPCNRFVSHPRWRIGDVFSPCSLESMQMSEGWVRLEALFQKASERCGGCIHLPHCRGGCPYAMATSGHAGDPACRVYRSVFHEMADETLREVFSQPNLDEVGQRGLGRHGLFRRGPLLRILRGGLHPKASAARARETVAAAALGCSRDPEEAVARLERAGLVTDPKVALASVTGLVRRLHNQTNGLANLYLHVTNACNLACTHCYARSGDDPEDHHMPRESILRLWNEVAAAGFQKLVITGGEPFRHPRFRQILEDASLASPRNPTLRRVLRTNLSTDLPQEIVNLLAAAFDEVVVSIDGDPAHHDLRRGAGAYERTVDNLRRLKRTLPQMRLGIAAALLPSEQTGAQGRAVRDLGRSLGIPVRFNPLLPLGRAEERGIPMSPNPLCDSTEEHDSPHPVSPSITCGLGTNLSVDPRGNAYPCHALSGEAHLLGNVLETGVAALIASTRFNELRLTTVDRNLQCARCALRYLCGGFCRAWRTFDHPDAPPLDCTPLHHRARRVLIDALSTLDTEPDRWIRAGLAFPDRPPKPQKGMLRA